MRLLSWDMPCSGALARLKHSAGMVKNRSRIRVGSFVGAGLLLPFKLPLEIPGLLQSPTILQASYGSSQQFLRAS